VKKLPLNYIGVFLLLVVFGLSLAQVLSNSFKAGEITAFGSGGKKIIRIAHWQLEPGYRVAMNKMIASYNELPRVKEANIQVQQVPVTEKVYGQWLNVHLMSGTAPDICEKGFAKMTSGDYVARYFEPLGDYVAKPNPYNQPEYLPQDIHKGLAKILAEKPWRETFNDGMKGGWDDKLQNHYAVPTSFFGAIRLYYNVTLINEAKKMIREGLAKSPYDSWLAARVEGGFVQVDAKLKQWASTDAPPDTLGRLLLCCSALRQMAKETGQDKLVPIAGSSYSQNMFADAYKIPFLSEYAQQVDMNVNSDITALETYAAWEAGVWGFDQDRVKAYYKCIEEVCKEFPPGFLALGRDQAINRFVLGQAAMVASGAWDANGIMKGAMGHSDSSKDFEVGIIPFPLPAKGEKWGEYVSYPANEAQANAGAPYAVTQRSQNVDWAIDFLQYMSSYAVNEQFNRDAGWIPVIMGTTPTDLMLPFSPNPFGLSKGTGVNFFPGSTNIRTIYEGQLWLYMSGDISYDDFAKAVVDGLENTQNGISRLWYAEWEKSRSYYRNNERMLATQKIRQMYQNDNTASDKFVRGVFKIVSGNNGNGIRSDFQAIHPGKEFPEF
jgi:raffinose/stachyose/melibiose transport system substrate-binding protein